MTDAERIAICFSCKHKDYTEHGMVCLLTEEAPNFTNSCVNHERISRLHKSDEEFERTSDSSNHTYRLGQLVISLVLLVVGISIATISFIVHGWMNLWTLILIIGGAFGLLTLPETNGTKPERRKKRHQRDTLDSDFL